MIGIYSRGGVFENIFYVMTRDISKIHKIFYFSIEFINVLCRLPLHENLYGKGTIL